MGIMLTEKAIEAAREKKLDLVQVAMESDPPVCRIMDYGKYKYKQKKRTQKSRHQVHASHVKEVRLKMRISEHDLGIKLRKARDFLEDGDRVLVNLLMRGREIVHRDIAHDKLKDFAHRLEDIAKVEQMPKLDGRRMTVVLTSK
jgi:translation initiation factor IF-3